MAGSQDLEADAWPLVSVIISSYNSEKFIDECIQSILNQSYQNFEIVIVDCSTDSTFIKINSYLDSRIKVFRFDTKISPAEARNYAIERSSGPFIALMDSDDICEPSRLEAQVLHLEKTQADVCSSYFYELNSISGKIKKSRQATRDADIRALLAIYNPICNPSVIVRASVLRRPTYRADYAYSEDSEMWCDLALRAKFTCCKRYLLRYRVHGAQMSQQFNSEALSWFRKASNAYIEKLLGLPWEPVRESFRKRTGRSVKVLVELNKAIPGVSWGANVQLYSRIQLKSNFLVAPMLRIERYVIAAYLTIVGQAYKHRKSA